MAKDSLEHQHAVDFGERDRAGRLFLLNGYDEDESDRVPPGAALDLNLPIWRIGEVVLFVSRLAEEFDENPSIVTSCRFTGLNGRALTSTRSHKAHV